jgi:uncharacterized protein YggE
MIRTRGEGGTWVGAAFVAVLLVGAAPACASAPAVGGGTPASATRSIVVPADTATISVTAEAASSVTPDRARLRFAIETEAETAATAADRNGDLTTAAIAAVRALASADDDLSTTGFSISPVYSRDGDRRVVGYRVVNALVVTLTDIERVGPVIDAAVGAGANRVDGLDFFAADSRAAYLDALARAVERARSEAETMARAAGGELGRVVSLQSYQTGQPVARAMAEGMAMAATPIEPGDQTIGASVRLEIQLVGR